MTTTVDEVDKKPGDGICATASDTCSLRAAVQEANRLPGIQTITVPEGIYQLSIPPGNEDGPDPGAGGDIDVLDNLIVVGANRTTTIVDGNHLSRIFDVSRAAATIRQMTIRNGTDEGGGDVHVAFGPLTLDNVIVEDNESSFEGGGIQVHFTSSVPGSALDIRNSIIRRNRAPSFVGAGGGIFAEGQITINSTLINGNQAGSSGGGLAGGAFTVIESIIIDNNASGDGGGISASGLNLMESSVYANTAGTQGGGVFASSGSIVNSTISDNSSGINGGGVSTSGTLALLHVTLAGNTTRSAVGNGLYRFGSTSELSLQNTILANPSGTECAGLPPASKGNNIASDTSCDLMAGGDKQATNALIGPLLDNGGPTRSHMPRVGSPAIDAAANVGLLRDQRGLPRPQGPRPDIGSVEFGALSGLPGDLNTDGGVDCTDLAIVRASFGKREGEVGFDARADVIKDGVIDFRDLGFIAERIPAGITCPAG